MLRLLEEYLTAPRPFSELMRVMVNIQQQCQPAHTTLNAASWEPAKVVKGSGQRRAKLEKTSWLPPGLQRHGVLCPHPERP